jgi:hypothetical protein
MNILRMLLAVATTVAGLHLPVATLDGKARTFPLDAEQPRSVFVVSFSKEASTAASEWTRRLHELHGKLSGAIFQVAILEDVPRLFRSLVVSSLASGVPRQLHDRFWVATAGTESWRRCADSQSSGEPHVFVLESGRIVWRSHGPVSEQKIRDLLALETYASQPANH